MSQQEQQCDEIERWISKSLDNELSVKEVGEMRRHLDRCTPCRESAEEARELRAWFVPSDPIAVPDGFAQRVVAEAFDAEVLQPLRAVSSGPGSAPASGLRLAGDQDAAWGASGESASSDRFLFRMTAVAAGLLVMLGLALSMQRLNVNTDLEATPDSQDSIIKQLEKLNEAEEPLGGADGADKELDSKAGSDRTEKKSRKDETR